MPAHPLSHRYPAVPLNPHTRPPAAATCTPRSHYILSGSFLRCCCCCRSSAVSATMLACAALLACTAAHAPPQLACEQQLALATAAPPSHAHAMQARAPQLACALQTAGTQPLQSAPACARSMRVVVAPRPSLACMPLPCPQLVPCPALAAAPHGVCCYWYSHKWPCHRLPCTACVRHRSAWGAACLPSMPPVQELGRDASAHPEV